MRWPKLITLVLFSILLLSGCAFPQWRVGQKTVPVDTGPSAQAVEAQRRSAALIVDLSATPTADPVGRIAEIHSVAVPLSASLGEPLKRAKAFELPMVNGATQAAVREAQAKAEKWKTFSRKYGGTPLEDTGINLAGPAGALGLIGVIALCIAVPPIGYVLLRMLPVLWGYFRSSTNGIANFIATRPEAAEDLKANLTRKMDASHKALVKLRGLRADPVKS